MHKSLCTSIAEFYQKFRVFNLRLRGYDINYTARVERFDRYNPKGVHIGAKTLVTSPLTRII